MDVCLQVVTDPTRCLVVKMVIVNDDNALPPPRGIAGRRGFAGIILVHKYEESGAIVVDLQLVDVVVSHVLKEILSPVCEYLPSTWKDKLNSLLQNIAPLETMTGFKVGN
ncbi:hypothetical protein R3W88_004882 [Solanum pinnatisectum]|uniref:DhaK domain-containing protein n=1 Tax=Solanum pinnatisectum TaxID=50273 RepID=A0AAV9KAN3_9SOLN|nr:hypothetical protein R3W88_004882 [Solanum pinnatisectum]